MAHALHRLLDSVWNTPHLVTEAALQPIVEYLQSRTEQGLPVFAIVPEAKTADEKKAENIGGIGEIQIDGVLTYKPVMGMCGPVGCSYQGIIEQAHELIAAGVDTILTVHNSPGGQAQHCFSTANELRTMCDEAGVKWIAYIDTLSASASLAFSVAADETVIHPSANTGSVGCVVALLDQSKYLSNIGIKPVYIASTPGKTPFADDGSFSAEFIKDVQSDVTRLGNQFAAHVSQYTGLPVEDIIAMDAKVFHAEEALEKGLVTAVMDHRQFAKHLEDMRK